MDSRIQNGTSENVVAGIVGALLGALAGGAIYFVLSLVGFISAISGLIGIVLAARGYAWLSKKESIKGVIIAAVLTLLAIVLAWYLILTKDVYEACKIWLEEGEIDRMPSFSQCFGNAYSFLAEPEIARPYYTNLAMGIIFAIIGGVGYLVNSIKSIKARNAAGVNQPAVAASQIPAEPVNGEAAYTESDPFESYSYTELPKDDK